MRLTRRDFLRSTGAATLLLSLDRLAFAHRPIAMSRFGFKQMKQAKLSKARYIPLAFDGGFFHPKDIRMFSKDKFNVGMVAANVGTYDRKAWQQNFEGYAKFHERHPDSMLYVHTDIHAEQSVNLEALARAVGIDIGFPFQWQYYVGHSRELMASIYNSFDVLLSCSRGEGFGIPIIEAQACGTPVIATDFSSMSELATALVQPAKLEWTPLNSWQSIPDVEQIDKVLEDAYTMKQDPTAWSEMKTRRVKFAEAYTLHNVMKNHMYPVFEEAAAAEIGA